ncbi:hypothetical protein GF354_03040 [Candidatus Peregrinibacteria bacterium]|nr:hypothetical protein [Candidatus Peregrinibacteria bacterium]
MKKILLIIVLNLLCCSAVFANTAFFSDVNEDEEFMEAIYYLNSEGIVNGHSDGTFKPENTLNRAEMLKIVIESKIKLGQLTSETLDEFEDSECFSDVEAGQWFTKYVCFAKNADWVVGYSDGTFRPGQKVNFVEALKMTLKSLAFVFEEGGEVWFEGAVNLASELNYIPYTITGFDDELKRNETADMITRILKDRNDMLEEYLGEKIYWVTTYESLKNGEAYEDQTPIEVTADTDSKVGLNLIELNESGVSGKAELFNTDEGLYVDIELNGIDPAHENPAQILYGTCDNIESSYKALVNLFSGESASLLELTIADLKENLPLAIGVQASNEDLSYISCADIVFEES